MFHMQQENEELKAIITPMQEWTFAYIGMNFFDL